MFNFFLYPVAVARYPKSAEERVRDFLLGHNNYSLRARPVLNSSNTVFVTMGMQLYAMLELVSRTLLVDINKTHLALRMALFYFPRDPFLTGRPFLTGPY